MDAFDVNLNAKVDEKPKAITKALAFKTIPSWRVVPIRDVLLRYGIPESRRLWRQ